MRRKNSRFAPRSKYPWGAPRTPCKARLCATFDPIRGGLCPLELPLRKGTACRIKRVYRQAEEPPGGGSFLFALSVLAALGHLSQRERQGTLTRCSGRGVGRQDRACGRGERIPTPVCTPRTLASRRALARNDRERTMCGRPFVGADEPVRPSPTQSARLPRRRRLDNGLGMGIIKIRGRCDKRSALNL